DKMLSAVLREVKDTYGHSAVEQIFDGIARRAIDKAKRKVTAGDVEGKVAQLTDVLRSSGVLAEYSLIDGGFELVEHNCPYSDVAKEHPEMCQVIHTVMNETLGGEHAQTESIATGGKACRFELAPHAIETAR
ncbi:MAG: helix-turn-helix transcriptional regulator, partial [Vulcanimicrobiaceae bacterium]